MRFRKRVTASVLTAALLCTSAGSVPVYGAPAGADIDETMYVNLDYYGKTSKVNVRKSRSVRSKKLTTLGKKKVVTVLGSKRKGGYTWYKVCFKKGSKTYNGYIASNYVKLK